MSLHEFRRLLAATDIQISSRTGEACRLVLVREETAYRASQLTGVSQGAISRALAKLRAVEPAEACPHCGRSL